MIQTQCLPSDISIKSMASVYLAFFKQAETVTRDEPVLMQKVFLYNQLNWVIAPILCLFFLHWADIITH